MRIGTRGSALALWQARWVQSQLRQAAIEAELEIIRTRGDRVQGVPLPQVGGKGLFTEELEEALRDGRIDVAVHSLKDLPTGLPEEFTLGAIPQRADARDVLLAAQPVTLAGLARGARVGTSSPRRAGQLLATRGDLEVLDLRGNVDTRLRKLQAGEYDAIVLAAAGVERLGLTELVREHLPPEILCPCPGQGALAIECRSGDEAVLRKLKSLDHAPTRFAVEVERGVLAGLGGGCAIPVGVYCSRWQQEWHVWAAVCKPDGTGIIRIEHSGPQAGESAASLTVAAAELARQVTGALTSQGARALLEP